jgi:hypothetical protein
VFLLLMYVLSHGVNVVGLPGYRFQSIFCVIMYPA